MFLCYTSKYSSDRTCTCTSNDYVELGRLMLKQMVLSTNSFGTYVVFVF